MGNRTCDVSKENYIKICRKLLTEDLRPVHTKNYTIKITITITLY